MQLVLDLNMIAMIVMVIETILVVALMVGWLYGARRMDFKTHHRAVYPIVLIHSITVGVWMIPIAIGRLPIIPVFGIVSSDFRIANLAIHDLVLGLILIIIGSLVDFLLDSKFE